MYYGQVRNINAPGGGKTTIIKPALGATYDRFILKFGAGSGLTAADLTEIRIIANDGEIFKDTASNLDSRQAYNAVDTDTAEVCIDFTEPNARGSAAEQYLASLPANLLKNLQIEVDIADAEGVGEDFTAISCSAEFRGPTKNPFILKRRRFNIDLAAASAKDFPLPSGISGGLIKRIWIHETGHVTAGSLVIGNRKAWEFLAIAELTRIQERNGRVPQSNIKVLDFVVDGNLQGALNTAVSDDIVLQATSDAAGSFPVYIDYIDPINKVRT